MTCTDSTIIGDVGSSGLRASVVQTRCTITGAIIAPVSAQVVTAFDDAYAALAAEQCTTTFASTSLGDHTFTPGVYCFESYVAETNAVWTLDGAGIYIFKIGTKLTGYLALTDFTVELINGATACDVYWWVAQYAELTRADFKGTILAGTYITITGTAPGTPFEGRALAKAAVTLTDVAFVGCEGGNVRGKCNQGVGNGTEECDPGNSNQGDDSRSNDEEGGTPGDPGRKGGNGK